MNRLQKELCFKLLTGGYYLMKSSNHKGKEVYKLYTGNQEIVRHFKYSDVKPFLEHIKSNDIGRITFNLSKFRQLHGKNYIKKTYKLLNIKL